MPSKAILALVVTGNRAIFYKCDAVHILAEWLEISGFLHLSADKTPGDYHYSQALPAQVGGQYKKPGNDISLPNLAAQGAEEISIAYASVSAENRLPDGVDHDRQDNDPQKKQSGKQGDFFAGELPESRRFGCGVHCGPLRAMALIETAIVAYLS